MADVNERRVARRVQDRRETPLRSGEDRRKINIPPPPGSPVRSGLDRRVAERRSGAERRASAKGAGSGDL